MQRSEKRILPRLLLIKIAHGTVRILANTAEAHCDTCCGASPKHQGLRPRKIVEKRRSTELEQCFAKYVTTKIIMPCFAKIFARKKHCFVVRAKLMKCPNTAQTLPAILHVGFITHQWDAHARNYTITGNILLLFQTLFMPLWTFEKEEYRFKTSFLTFQTHVTLVQHVIHLLQKPKYIRT